ncbi:MAG: monovalent cation/H(+) antiporter subunit G [Nocardioidaceae bacterium]
MEILQGVLLWAGVLVLVAAGVGTTFAPGVFVRLHYVGLGAVVGLPLVLLSEMVAQPAQAPKLVVVLVLQVLGAPALTTAMARAEHRSVARDGAR